LRLLIVENRDVSLSHHEKMLWRSLHAAAETVARRLFAPQMSCSIQLAGVGPGAEVALQEALWFAVPKSKISRSKKRMKTTVQKRIPLRLDIVADPRTGEPTLKHKLPFSWKETYIPKFD
jgi:ribosomal protein L32